MSDNPQDLNNDGTVTQSEKNRYRKGERKAPGGGTTGGGTGTTGTTGTTGPTGPAVVKPTLPAGTTGRKIEDTDILWGTGEYGGVVSYKSKGAAENYLTKDAPEYETIKASYDAWGKSVYGSRTSLAGFWKKVVGAAQSTATTPWAVLSSYNSQFPGGSLDGTTSPVGTETGAAKFVGTSRSDLDYFIDSTIQAAFNRPATAQEKDMFAKQYSAGEKLANKQARTGKGPGWSKDKYTKDFLTNSLRSSLGVEPDAQLLGDAGGIQDQLEQYAADMGLTKTLRGINSDVIRVMQGENINDVMRGYKDEAIIMFKPLADRLKADNPANLKQGLKVKDILSPYTSFIEDLTDKVRGSVKLTDSIVQKIISSDILPDMGTVNQWVRDTDDFAKSTTAKKEAQDLGVSFLKAFGWGNK
jgi:hypothetical protein